ncbi:MAG: signal recognition particle protein [candidate division Zixibacteria bacterium]|nr:signal recognition particle protein [candidate division Zixibacteria bacterium]
MFEELAIKFESITRKLRGYGKLTEDNIRDSLREVRKALLEADVNYKVVKKFIDDVQGKSLGEKTIKSIRPGEQIIKIVYDQLCELLGGKAEELKYSLKPPTVLMLVGLQGSGKTTACAKLAKYIKKKGRNPLMVAADTYRPAAAKQLEILGKTLSIDVFSSGKNPIEISKKAVDKARQEGFDSVLLDTAGRLHIDEDLMQELCRIKKEVSPSETVLVVDAMTGQEALNIAQTFDQRVGLDSIFLTKLDGDARGGAALSIRAMTGKPIKFVGVGEKLDQMELFHPERMASRILGMGDVVSLVEKTQEAISLEEAEKLEEKLKKGSYTLEDFYDQLQQIKKMGPLESILKMIPGLGGKALQNVQVDDKSMNRVEAMINSMTPEERKNPYILDGSRKKRVAKGSGTSVQEINRLVKQFFTMQKMIKDLGKMDFNKLKGMASFT